MEVNISSSNILTWCLTGNLATLRHFLETTLPSLPRDQQAKYCNHAHYPCADVPCPSKTSSFATLAAQGGQPTVFAYLWDTFLAGREAKIPWDTLRAAAVLGSIPLAETFCARDRSCFMTVEPQSPHSTAGGETQVKVTMRHDRFDYVNYLLTHGADINCGFPAQSPVRAAVHSAVDSGKTSKPVFCVLSRLS